MSETVTAGTGTKSCSEARPEQLNYIQKGLSVIKGGTLESKSMICSLAGLIDQGHDEDA